MKYTLRAKLIAYYETEIEADSFEEAHDIADELEFDDFEDTGDGEFYVYDIEDEDGHDEPHKGRW